MTIPAEVRATVRRRANFRCEFCEVTEVDSGGELTIDHFRPGAKGGGDTLDNLIYCCARCNQHKLDYWPSVPGDAKLWNPRLEPRDVHFLELEDGALHPLTTTAAFTIQRLRLNRFPLIAYRLRRRKRREEARLLAQYEELLQLQEQLQRQVIAIAQEQQRLLEEQKRLLALLLTRLE